MALQKPFCSRNPSPGVVRGAQVRIAGFSCHLVLGILAKYEPSFIPNQAPAVKTLGVFSGLGDENSGRASSEWFWSMFRKGLVFFT